jgi:hypothetical protein
VKVPFGKAEPTHILVVLELFSETYNFNMRREGKRRHLVRFYTRCSHYDDADPAWPQSP